ncbi:MAG: 3'-5' exoribonuclease [Bacteroidota bacterium]|nr:3'-5' exoribonuclease [Bacteroidota bacterium]
MTKVFLDTEFTGLHQGTSLISLALVAESGEEFYGEFTDYDKKQLNEWLKENVIPKLWLTNNLPFQKSSEGVYQRGDRKTIKEALEKWLTQFEGIEIWADVLAYDWVLFCELFGGALNLPKNIFFIPFDLATLAKIKGLDPDFSRFEYSQKYLSDEEQKMQHNALSDAKTQCICYQKLLSNMTTDNNHIDLTARIKQYRVDFCYSKELFFVAAQRIRNENNKRFVQNRILNITSILLAIITASGVAFYFTKINEEATVIIMGLLAIISLGIAIYLIIEKKHDNEDEYIKRAEEYLNLYKYTKNIESKISENQISKEELAKEIDKIHLSQYRISTHILHTTDEDRQKSWKQVQHGGSQYSEKDFQLT